jgi:hypothetical protein
MDQINNQISKMFQLAKLTGASASQEEQVQSQSGISKAFDFHETNAALTKKAGNLEDGEMRLWRTFAKWEGQKEFDGNVSYPREYNVKELMQELDEAEKLMKFNLGKMFTETMNREIIKKKFPRLPDDEVDQMVEESKADTNTGASLRSRLPGFFNNNNALPGGINGGNGNGKIPQN